MSSGQRFLVWLGANAALALLINAIVGERYSAAAVTFFGLVLINAIAFAWYYERTKGS